MAAFPSYPDTGGPTGPAWGPVEALPELDMPEQAHQRRLTVLLRLLLLIPQALVLIVLAVGAFFAAIGGWFAALVLGRLPDGIARYLTAYVGYDTRVYASAMLMTDRYPPFQLRPSADYPVRVEIPEPGPLNRLAVLFRIILVIPAAIVESVAAAGWWAVSFILWLIVLIMGRMPRTLFEASAAILRYSMRLKAYWLMVTPAYPKRLFGDGTLMAGAPPVGAEPDSATRPLLLGTGGKTLLVVFLVLGVLSGAANGVRNSSYYHDGNGNGGYWNAPAPATAPVGHPASGGITLRA